MYSYYGGGWYTFGSITALGGVVTWKRVNIRSCLGGLYNKYNTFNLKLTAAQMKHNQLTNVAIQTIFDVSLLFT